MKTTTVRNAFAGRKGTYTATVNSSGLVAVYDSVAGHYTTCHSLTRCQVASVARKCK